MLLSLTTVPNPLLRQPSLAVPQMNTKNVQFLKDMANTLIHKSDPPGVGLSAVQVGTPARIFMTYLPNQPDLVSLDGKHPPQELKIFINPEIIDYSEQMTLGPDPKHPALEGCLSIPNLYGPVPRHQTIKIKYQTLDRLTGRQVVDGKSTQPPDHLTTKIEVFSHFFARVIQHEFDHLNGKLFTDYLDEGVPLYFDQGDHLTEIQNPSDLVQW